MTGGFAYVLDQDNSFVDRVNHELVEIQRISRRAWRPTAATCSGLITSSSAKPTASGVERCSTTSMTTMRRFWLVKPKAADFESLLASTRGNPAVI